MTQEIAIHLRKMLRGKDGMTLVEVIVSMAITVIILSAAGGILLFSGNMSRNVGSAGLDKLAGDKLTEFIEDQLVFAAQIEITYDEFPKTENGYNHVLRFCQNGYVYLDGKNLYGENYDRGRELACSVERTEFSENLLSFQVKVLERGDMVYHSHSTVRLLNVGLRPEWKIRYDFEDGCDTMDSEEQDLYIYYQSFIAEE